MMTRGRGAVTAGQRGVLVAGVVVDDLERQLLGPLGDEAMSEVLAVAVGGAGDPGRVRRVLVQALEGLLRLRDLGRPDHAARFPTPGHLHRAAHAIQNRHRQLFGNGIGDAGQRSTPDDHRPGAVFGDSLHARFDERLAIGRWIRGDRGHRTRQDTHAGELSGESVGHGVRRDGVAQLGVQGDDGEAVRHPGGRLHGRLGDAEHRTRRGAPGLRQPGIAEGRNDDGIDFPMTFVHHGQDRRDRRHGLGDGFDQLDAGRCRQHL